MVLSNIDPDKRKSILNFFKVKFNIDLEKYEEDEIPIVFSEIKNIINKRIIDEKYNNNKLLSSLEKAMVDVLLMLN